MECRDRILGDSTGILMALSTRFWLVGVGASFSFTVVTLLLLDYVLASVGQFLQSPLLGSLGWLAYLGLLLPLTTLYFAYLFASLAYFAYRSHCSV